MLRLEYVSLRVYSTRLQLSLRCNRLLLQQKQGNFCFCWRQMQLKHEPVKYYSHYFCLLVLLRVYCSIANCLATVHSVLESKTGIKNRQDIPVCLVWLYFYFLFKHISWQRGCRYLSRPSVQSQSMLVGASRVLCCVVNIYGMQNLSWLSLKVETPFWGNTRLNKEPFLNAKGTKKKKNVLIFLFFKQTTSTVCQVLQNWNWNISDLLALIYLQLSST